jgi:hypothetical protein
MNIRKMNNAKRVAQAEYRDAQGYTHTEYLDRKGNIYTEYQDNKGTLHSYRDGYIHGHLAEERRQAARTANTTNNESRKLLAGIMIIALGAVTIGVIYALTRPDTPEPLPPVVNVEAPAPTQSSPEVPVVEQPIPVAVVAPVTPTPAPPEQPEPTPNVNVTVNPTIANPTPSADSAPAPVDKAQNPSPATPTTVTPTVTDSNLKAAIAKRFQSDLPNHKLTIEVKNAVVTVSGTVATPEDLQQISPLLASITGIKQATIKATVAP